MTLQEQFKVDLKTAMKEKNEQKKNVIRVIMGEFARADSKIVPDEDVIKILRKLIKSEKELLAKSSGEKTSPFITIIETYLPDLASEEDIRMWITDNIDFTGYKNKMQAMRDIMGHFGQRADGNMVKTILQQF